MLEALVITLREGVEAALIIGITLAYLAKIGRPELRKTVYAGLVSAFVASIAIAVALSKTNYNPDLFEGWIMLVASFFVVSMVVFMARAAKSLKGDIEKRVGGFADAGSKFGIFAFVFLMVLREGVETVLILSAVTLTTNELFAFLGTLIGVALSILFGVTFVRGSMRINLGKFFKVTTVILIFVACQLAISGLHELSENGVIPSSKRQMAIIGPIVRNDIFFFVTMLALAAMMVLFESRRRGPAPDQGYASKAEQRKAEWSARRERLWTTAVYVSSFIFIILVTAQFIYAKSTTALSPASDVAFTDGKTTIQVGDMQVGELRRYSSQLHGQPVRFLIYKKPNGKIATVMDACSICGSVGFYNNGAQGITCKNCNAPINPQTVGEGGGCNPIPLVADVNGSSVTVTELELSNSASKIKE
ncbi:MAG: iron permease [Candidatus Angelobacter sp.]|jgi:high-affinity iron transporter|nr:iron permease [Candidatus Angelobacter sp.]